MSLLPYDTPFVGVNTHTPPVAYISDKSDAKRFGNLYAEVGRHGNRPDNRYIVFRYFMQYFRGDPSGSENNTVGSGDPVQYTPAEYAVNSIVAANVIARIKDVLVIAQSCAMNTVG